MNHALYRVSLV